MLDSTPSIREFLKSHWEECHGFLNIPLLTAESPFRKLIWTAGWARTRSEPGVVNWGTKYPMRRSVSEGPSLGRGCDRMAGVVLLIP